MVNLLRIWQHKFFKIGCTIVDTIISYINKRVLDEKINEDTQKN